MSVYSPSQTAVFKECPLSWWLRYNSRYVPRTYNQKEIAGAVGSAFSTYQEYIDKGHDAALEIGREDLVRMLADLDATRELSERAVNYKMTAEGRYEKFCELYQREPKIPRSWTMFDRERSFLEHGNCRVDSMYETSMGELGVLDFKTRGRIQANQRDKARRDFATSDQMYHYCWAASEVYGQPITQFSILILTLEPKPWIDLWQYRVRDEFMKVWIAGRRQDWWDMDQIKAGNRTPTPASVHENKFGQCQYYDVCFKHGFVEEHVQQDFVIRQ